MPLKSTWMGLVVLAATMVWSAPARAERVALLIGNAAYSHESALANPLNDVRAMERVLREIGFTIFDRVENADFHAMTTALRAFSKRARRAETALIFYAGHGMEIEGSNFLIPVDAELSRSADAFTEAVLLDQVIAAAAGASRLSAVIIDACRTNRFPASTRGGWRGLRAAAPHQRQIVAHSTAPGEFADDGLGDLSPFTEALVELLPKHAAKTDVLKFFTGLEKEVSDRARRVQRPHAWVEGFGFETVPLAPPLDPAAPSAALAEPPSDASRLVETEEERAAAERDWADVAESRSIARLRDFLKKHPRGPFANAARDRIEGLRRDFREAQRMLKERGFDAGRIDGYWGENSARALRRFYESLGRPPQSALTDEALALLRTAPRADPPAVVSAQPLSHKGRVEIAVGDSIIVSGVPGDCGGPAPGWGFARIKIKPLRTDLGAFSAGGARLMTTALCAQPTMARAILFTAQRAGVESFAIDGAHLTIVVR